MHGPLLVHQQPAATVRIGMASLHCQTQQLHYRANDRTRPLAVVMSPRLFPHHVAFLLMLRSDDTANGTHQSAAKLCSSFRNRVRLICLMLAAVRTVAKSESDLVGIRHYTVRGEQGISPCRSYRWNRPT